MVKEAKLFKLLIIILFLFLMLEAVGYYLGSRNVSTGDRGRADRTHGNMRLDSLRAKNVLLRQRLRSLTPNEIYIAVDTGRNKLYLKKGDKTIHEAVISSGTGNILNDPSSKRLWVFDTPRGEYHVETKYQSPAWIKPDWAFIEEGEVIPKNPRERIEEGVLGDYALGFGNGYFIHGTLYTRLLGRNVTHGCIRVGDKDLKRVYTAAAIGTRIYIF